MTSSERDERLAAYLDGALSAAEEARFDRELERDPDLARKALQWRDNDRFIAATLVPRARAVEPDLLARMGLDDAARRLPTAVNDNNRGWRIAASAAALALVLGASLVALRPAGMVPASDPVSLALETTPSAQGARLADGRVLTPVLTVRAADGRWCREYTLADQAALACRHDGGRWMPEAQGAASGAPHSGGDFAAAAGEADPALEAAYHRIGAQTPLGPDEEAALLRARWR